MVSLFNNDLGTNYLVMKSYISHLVWNRFKPIHYNWLFTINYEVSKKYRLFIIYCNIYFIAFILWLYNLYLIYEDHFNWFQNKYTRLEFILKYLYYSKNCFCHNKFFFNITIQKKLNLKLYNFKFNLYSVPKRTNINFL